MKLGDLVVAKGSQSGLVIMGEVAIIYSATFEGFKAIRVEGFDLRDIALDSPEITLLGILQKGSSWIVWIQESQILTPKQINEQFQKELKGTEQNNSERLQNVLSKYKPFLKF